MYRTRKSAATGEASGKRGGDGPAADVPRGDGGVAAAPSSPPAARSRKRTPPAIFKNVVASRVGVCLHYERHGRLIRENLTVEKCHERIAALAHDADAVAMWAWKLEQIETHPTG